MMNTKTGKLIVFLIAGAALLLLPILLQSTGSNSWVRILDIALLYVLLALGLNIVVGYAGLLDLGYIAFFAVGAYVFALLGSPHLTDTFPAIKAMFPEGIHYSIWIVMIVAAVIAGIVGMILGAPTLKLRGDYLAIITLGFGEIIRIFLLNMDRPVNITNGPKGISQIDTISVFGVDLGKRFTVELGDFTYTFQPVTLYYYLFLFFVILAIIISYRLQDSRIGLAWMAIRED
jgi:branched-chain amino acid transport system permease protein